MYCARDGSGGNLFGKQKKGVRFFEKRTCSEICPEIRLVVCRGCQIAWSVNFGSETDLSPIVIFMVFIFAISHLRSPRPCVD